MGVHEMLPRLRSWWLGRIVVHGIRAFIQLDMFDRSMTIAAQFFSSVFPILILFATWARSRDADLLADALGLPPETRSVLQDATQGAKGATFGILGILLVLASATSLSRALTRCYAAIWQVDRPKTNLGSAWRWLSVVVVLTLSLVLARAVSEPFPPRDMLPLVESFALDTAVAFFVPWVLLAGALKPRLLAPGALLFALLMLTVRPASAAWLPHALEVSAERYGSIGVAFTYLACLYVAALSFLATAVVGKVIATDHGRLGRWIRGTTSAPEAVEMAALPEAL
jgi:membrane protein